METLIFTEQKNSNKWKNNIKEAFLALFLTIGTWLCLKDMFQLTLHFSKETMGGIGSGLICTWNQIADVLGNSNYFLLPKFEGGSQGNDLFLLVLFMFLMLVFFFLIKSKNTWTMLTVFIVMALLSGVTELEITTVTGILFGAALVASVLYMKEGDESFLKNLIFIAGTAVIIAGLFSFPIVQKMESKPQFVRKMNELAGKTVSDSYYGTNILKNGDMTQRKRQEGQGEAFEITMSNPQSIYLRGFVGDYYKKDRWEPLQNNSYYEMRELLYWLEQDGFQAFGQLGQARSLTAGEGETTESNAIQIKVKEADRRYAYIPYELKGDVEKGKSWGGNFITPSGLERLSAYGYEAEENAVKTWTDTAARIFAGAGDAQPGAELEKYLVCESYYNTYVYENFTYLSKEDKSLLRKHIGKAGDQSGGHIDYKPAISGVRKYLEENFIYTENLGPVSGESKNALEEFFLSKKGYDVQFATAATMMFRYYGIPARYVEGYLVTPEDADSMESGKPKIITKDRAHAWVEIYIDGTGFIPIEVCPSYQSVMEEADMEIGISNNTLLRPFENNQGNQGLGTELETAGDDDESFEFSFALLMMILLGILLILILCWLLYKALQIFRRFWQRRKLFRKAEAKIAVSAMFSYMEEQNYPISDEARLLGNKAAYSLMPIEEAERSRMITILKDAAKEKKKDEKRKKQKKSIFFRNVMCDGGNTSDERLPNCDISRES